MACDRQKPVADGVLEHVWWEDIEACLEDLQRIKEKRGIITKKGAAIHKPHLFQMTIFTLFFQAGDIRDNVFHRLLIHQRVRHRRHLRAVAVFGVRPTDSFFEVIQLP